MTSSNQIDKLESLKKYAKLLDSQFTIPGTKFKFGIDPLLSFIPILGTFSGFITGFILIFSAHKKGVSGKVKALMLKNIFVDFLFGLIPIYGNIKDFFYKANQKNIGLIEEHLLEDKHQGSGVGLMLLYLLLVLGIFLGSILLFSWVLTSFLNFIFN